ncbi:MAG: UDP-N-acetylmuramate--L-alanine ligase [Deltaproteobacteria bacterium GWA2_38_16]|nr:MAG: UDP-N-acetylmuramate--L-alanine ligase [Deltaproteobacteria bacterium GWA2_38_16]OGQ02409.1 MAG: UDP-N-acetylmuramate--L-alanine ligase [Deltaproteobacteria bacterium RIFCSPHIGHO2_02_FULL_38_15]HBQ20746.1 UDP-N-acetylmuramate--L-alanine ligase [Deltaproteobacteria bacterium]
MQKSFRHVHFVGIGGIGMSGIAEVLLNLGYKISGSDLATTEITKRLNQLGATIYLGHRSLNIKKPDVVVISSAVSKSNPEVLKAKKLKIPVIPRAEMLAELMKMKYAIAIAGTHGKTTTTSISGTLLATCKVDPTVVIGGRLNKWGTNAKLGQGKFLVAEADESDGSFNLLTPTIAIVTNIDADHLDYYKNMEAIKDAFVTFLNRLPFYGVGIVCGDEKNILSILPRVNKRIITYGISSRCDFQARHIELKGITSSFDVYVKRKKLGRFSVKAPGIHNVKNTLACIIMGLELGLSLSKIKKGILAYSGVQRRFHIRGEVNGITVMDDYGHHPTEIKATLEACKKVWPKRRLLAVFQPHRYTRTRDLMKEFSGAFQRADVLLLTEIYSAGEKPIKGVSSEKLYRLLRKKHKHACLVASRRNISHELEKHVRPKDVVLLLGAGDIWKSGLEFLEVLKKQYR